MILKHNVIHLYPYPYVFIIKSNLKLTCDLIKLIEIVYILFFIFVFISENGWLLGT